MRRLSCLAILLVVLATASCASFPSRARNGAPHVGKAGSQPEAAENFEEVQVTRSGYETLDPALTQPPTHRPPGSISLSQPEQHALHSQSIIREPNDPLAQRMIEEEFVYLNRDVRDRVAGWLKRSEKYLPHAKQVFSERGLPEDLVYLAYIESGYNPEALSRSGAAGVWQFMPMTGRKYGLHNSWWIDERRDPYKAAHAAASYLSTLYKMFGDWTLAIASYNAGEGKVGRAIAQTGSRDVFHLIKNNASVDERNQLKQETINYVPRFFAMVKIAKNHQQLGYEPLNLHRAPDIREVTVPGNTDLKALARAVGQDWVTFASHNPAFRRDVVPPDESGVAYVPAQALAQAASFVANPTLRKAAYTAYVTQRGDSWNSLAARSNTSVEDLKQLNKQTSDTLKSGQKITLPGRSVAAVGPAASVSTSANKAPQVAAKFPGAGLVSQAQPQVFADSRDPGKQNRPKPEYRVQNGDTLYSIAKRNNVEIDELMRANSLQSGREVTVGRILYLPSVDRSPSLAAQNRDRAAMRLATPRASQPAPDTAKSSGKHRTAHYIVRRGDTLDSIAQQFAVSPKDIIGWNNLNNGQKLQPGNQIAILMD